MNILQGFRRIKATFVTILATLWLSGCGIFAGWDQMAEAQPSGNIAISIAESGDVSIHMIACDIAVESVEIHILTGVVGEPPLSERISLDSPQSGYIVVKLPHYSDHEPPVLNSIVEDSQQRFWIHPITYRGNADEHRFVPPLNGLTLDSLKSYPRGSLLVQNYIPGTHEPETLNEVSLEEFKHGSASSRPPNCRID
ncbi:hypothetical protein [Corynebacterium liangguodongii]|uniref:hypothetical protein n=1 Tax=Corynebacterium liangguodongii TaxID=2079535 RepID=UPI0011B26B21|nr:hypothetical protein [Corynebacterium liangguodongii]